MTDGKVWLVAGWWAPRCPHTPPMRPQPRRSREASWLTETSRRYSTNSILKIFLCSIKIFWHQPCHECLECQDNADPALCPPGHLRVFNGSKWRKESRVYWQSHSDTDYTRSVPSPAWPNTNDNETFPELPCQKCGQWARGAAARQQVSQVW